jgi:hypothetical protein
MDSLDTTDVVSLGSCSRKTLSKCMLEDDARVRLGAFEGLRGGRRGRVWMCFGEGRLLELLDDWGWVRWRA